MLKCLSPCVATWSCLAMGEGGPETVTLYGSNEGEACLSLAIIVAVTVFPHDLRRRNELMDAFAAWLVTRGCEVVQQPHPMLKIRRRAWLNMSKAKILHVLGQSAYLLRRRRLAAVELSFFRQYRPAGRSLNDVHNQFHKNRWGRSTSNSANNVRILVWSQSKSVLHIAYALKIELEYADISAWNWPLLCVSNPVERLARLVKNAENWRLALQRPPLGSVWAESVIPDAVQIRLAMPANLPNAPAHSL